MVVEASRARLRYGFGDVTIGTGLSVGHTPFGHNGPIDITVAFLILAAAILATAAWLRRGRLGTVLLAAALFVLLAALALGINAETLTTLDNAVAEWFDTHRTRRRDLEAAGVFGYLGRPIHVLLAALVGGALLSVRARSALPVVCVTGAVGVGVIVEGTLKAVIGRTATTGPVMDYPHTFPSGHVTGTTALLGTIAVCLGAGGSRALRWILAIGVSAAVLFVAFLALYTGAHTFTDVIGGMILGAAIVASAAAILGAGRAFRASRSRPTGSGRSPSPAASPPGPSR